MAKNQPSDATSAVTPPDPAAKIEDAPLAGADMEAAQMALKRGTLEFAAPGYMGGSRITLAKGEPVPATLWPHVAESDHDLFEPYTAPVPALDTPKA